tara:strand:+ start:215 stop:661 length:447 start_codon:yes stop_codon:yes gene_type:complete
MASFAKIGKGNIVEKVEVVSNDIATTEQAGVDFLRNLYNDQNGQWFQTSYNTRGGTHYQYDGETLSEDQSKAFRKNHAGIGYKYNQTKDAFIPLKPFNSWILNETTCLWEAPIEKPLTYNQGRTDEDGNTVADIYVWNETNKTWDLIE